MAFRLSKVDTKTLKTADEVRELALKLKAYGGTESEREDKAMRKAHIRDKILLREATPFRWAIGKVKSGLIRRVNGQHSSDVFLELTPEDWKAVAFPVVVVWEEYECDTIRDLPVLFEQFDPSWSGRNKEDLVGAHLGIHDDLRSGINRKVATRVTNGMLWYHVHVRQQEVGPETCYQYIHSEHDAPFLIWCGSFLSPQKTREMLSPSVVAALYHTYQTAGPEDRDFWKSVASGKACLNLDTIEYKLAEFLEMAADDQADWPAPIRRHFKSVGNKMRPSKLDIFATCLRAFQAMKKGTKVGEIFMAAKGRPAAQIVEDTAP